MQGMFVRRLTDIYIYIQRDATRPNSTRPDATQRSHHGYSDRERLAPESADLEGDCRSREARSLARHLETQRRVPRDTAIHQRFVAVEEGFLGEACRERWADPSGAAVVGEYAARKAKKKTLKTDFV